VYVAGEVKSHRSSRPRRPWKFGGFVDENLWGSAESGLWCGISQQIAAFRISGLWHLAFWQR
jgi:hypothetical protein